MRVQEEAGKPDLNFAEIRKEAIEDYRMLVKHIEAHAVINPSETLQNLINNVNELIDKYNQIKRKGKSTADNSEPEEPIEPEA
jgi:hypothetical protein